MKAMLAIALFVSVITPGCLVTKKAVPAARTAVDSAQQWVNNNKQPVDISSYQSFVRSTKIGLKNMGFAKIVGLGESTHGTSEFQTVRAYISRYLCEEKGFNTICLENSYGWSVELNKYVQTGQGNLDTLMKKNMLGIWQNTETKQLLQWMKSYNQSHTNKLQLAGMDYSETGTTTAIIKSMTQKLSYPLLNTMIDTLDQAAHFIDAAYADFNNPKSKFQWKDMLNNGVKGYTTALLIKSTLDSMKNNLAARLSAEEITSLYTALYNCELAYYSIYKPVKEKAEASRDEAMASMVKRIMENHPGSKIIVWAHNAHIARGAVFGDDSNGGGSGKFLDAWFPGQYYALGTGTTSGTFSATTDQFILSTSILKSHPLSKAVANSWEQVIANAGSGNFFIDTRDKKTRLPLLPLRFTGYRASTDKDFIEEKLSSLYDGFIFIPVTQATHIQQ
jgi:erythromycin esterase